MMGARIVDDVGQEDCDDEAYTARAQHAARRSRQPVVTVSHRSERYQMPCQRNRPEHPPPGVATGQGLLPCGVNTLAAALISATNDRASGPFVPSRNLQARSNTTRTTMAATVTMAPRSRWKLFRLQLDAFGWSLQ